MLTKAQFVKYGQTEMLWYRAKKEDSSDLRRLETKLFAYEEMLTETGETALDHENYVHTDVIADIAHLHERHGLTVDFYGNKDALYVWSINYTKTCIENGLKPSSVAAARFINRLPSQIVATLGNKIPVQNPE